MKRASHLPAAAGALVACALVLAIGEEPELTGLSRQGGQWRLTWSQGLDRYIVEQIDPESGASIAIGTSSGRVENAAQIAGADVERAIFRLRSGLQAVRLSDAALDDALRTATGPSTSGPTNWIYDADTRRLTNLTVAMRGVATLEGLNALDDLTWFDLGGNRIGRLADLSASPNLRVLRLDGNNLSSLTGIESLTQLDVLDVSHNALSNLAPVAALATIEVLYADRNAVDTADFAANLTQLRLLDLSGNRITTITPLLLNAQQGGLGPGDQVFLAGNPLSNTGEVAALRGYGATVYFP